MLLRRLRTLSRDSKSLLWKGISRTYGFCAYDIRVLNLQDSTSTGLHRKRQNACTTRAVCISGMFTLNLNQYQRGDLSLVSLETKKVLHHMRLDAHTNTTGKTMYETSSALHFGDCIPQHLAEKNKLLHLLFAD